MMAKEILIFAIVFFGFMTVYNLIISIRRKESFTPAIVSFLMTSGVSLIFFGRDLYGSALFVIAMIVALMNRSTTLKIPERKLLQELENVDNKEHIKPSDFLSGQKVWAKLIIKHGAKRAAVFYGLYIAICSTIVLWLFSWGFPEDVPPDWYWLEFIVIISALFYYHQRKIFENALGDLNEKTDRGV
jgi:drug/metabolite transporter (DMT)-like permease